MPVCVARVVVRVVARVRGREVHRVVARVRVREVWYARARDGGGRGVDQVPDLEDLG